LLLTYILVIFNKLVVEAGARQKKYENVVIPRRSYFVAVFFDVFSGENTTAHHRADTL